MTCARHARTDSSERTSSATMVTPCDCVLSGLRAVPNTLNPRWARSRAVAWPMPDDAHVTKIVCDIDSPGDCVSDNGTPSLSVPSAYYPYLSFDFSRLLTPYSDQVRHSSNKAISCALQPSS